MKIGILGSGEVGKTLAQGFIKNGYEVMIGTRDKNKLSDFAAKTNIKIESFEEAAKYADIAVLCVKGAAAKEVLNLAGKENLKGKIIIDTTNPLADSPPENGVLKFFTSLDNSLMEQLQSEFPDLRFVKAFNSIGNSLMVNPDFSGIKPSMFICGNDPDAKKEVSIILEKFGFEPEDFGKAESARVIEPLCILWCIPGFLNNKWSNAFKLLKK